MKVWKAFTIGRRILVTEPGLAAVTILTVALGVGANTAIFSFVSGVLLRPLPFAEPERLVSLREVIPALAQTYPNLPVSARHFEEWKARSSSFAALSALELRTATLTGRGEPEQVREARVSANTFDMLGVKPVLGRGFAADEEQGSRSHVVVITDPLWRRRFGADRAVLGSGIQLDSEAYTIIGVLPASFRFPATPVLNTAPDKPDLFRPLVFDDDELKQLMGRFNYTVTARLRPGVPADKANAELNVIAGQLAALSGAKVDLRAAVLPLREAMVGKSRRALLVLLGAVASVLLIVCVNLANLLLARSERRARESAVRVALGAGRIQLVWSALLETLPLAVVGGLLGIGIAAIGLRGLVASAPADLPRLDEVTLNFSVLLFGLGVTLLTGFLFGLAPAWRATRVDPQDALKAGGRTSTGAAGGARLRGFLVTAEVGLSMALLFAAALFSRSFVRLIDADQGFRMPAVLATDLQIPWAKYKEKAERAAFHDRVLARLRSQPGVLSAAVVNAVPLTGETWVDVLSIPGDNRPEFEKPPVNVRMPSPDYFDTMGIPMLAGRTFTDKDKGRDVAIVSERIAHLLWPGQSAIGRQIINGGKPCEVLAVVGDVRADAHKPPVMTVYRPHWFWPGLTMKLVARAAGDPKSIAGAVRAAVRSVDPDVPLAEMHTMREVLAQSVAQRKLQAVLTLVFAGTALLLAGLGVYGVVSYSVSRRINEMGIRMALGASARNLCAMVVRQAMLPVVLGVIVGLAAAFAAGRLLASLLYEVSPRDPVILSAVSVVLLVLGLAASLIPAVRAARSTPVEALHYE